MGLNIMQKKGYSLIELTVVVGLVAILGVGISSAVLMSISTTIRNRATTHVRESGDYALNQVKQLIRNSKSILACDSNGNTLDILGLDGGTTSISLESAADSNRLASGSGQYLTPSDITLSSFSLTCLPSDTEVELIKLQFSAELSSQTAKDRENPLVNFQTSVSLRNN